MKKNAIATRRRFAVTLAPRMFLGLTFLLSGTGKLPGQAEFADYLLKSFWGPTTAFLISRLVPWLELVLGIMFLLRLAPRFASFVSLPLIVGFIINNTWAISQGISEFPECAYCFGFFEEFFGAITPAQSLGLDIVLLVAALVIIRFHPGGFFKLDPWIMKKTRRIATSSCSLIFVLIAYGACNQAPVISELKSDRTNYDPASDSQITCVISDQEEDDLTYTWTASGGTLSGEGATVNWRAPDELGAYQISVRVRDDQGREAVMEKKIKVGENRAPIIRSMISEYEAIERSETGKLKCTAEDPDGDALTFTWTANRGAISGDGPNASWVAPNSYVNAIITVTVEDEWGRKTAKKLIQPVVCCDTAKKNPNWK